MRVTMQFGRQAWVLFALAALLPAVAVAIDGIPQGTPVVADGTIGDPEWADARAVPVALSASVSVTVLVKHDGTNLLAAYQSTYNPFRTLFMPELVVDPAGDRATSWQADDWWFHVSASDCDAAGRWDDYSNCKIVQPDWIGVPNYPMNTPSPALIEQFEVSIPLGKLGLAVGDTLGLALTAVSMTHQRGMWPAAASMNSPATWAQVVLCNDACAVTSTVPAGFGAVKSLYK